MMVDESAIDATPASGAAAGGTGERGNGGIVWLFQTAARQVWRQLRTAAQATGRRFTVRGHGYDYAPDTPLGAWRSGGRRRHRQQPATPLFAQRKGRSNSRPLSL